MRFPFRNTLPALSIPQSPVSDAEVVVYPVRLKRNWKSSVWPLLVSVASHTHSENGVVASGEYALFICKAIEFEFVSTIPPVPLLRVAP